MLPLFNFSWPCITSHTQRGYNKNFMHLKAIEKQGVYCRQRNACLAKPHTKQERRNGVSDYEFGGIPLIIMRILFHLLSLQSDPFHQGYRSFRYCRFMTYSLQFNFITLKRDLSRGMLSFQRLFRCIFVCICVLLRGLFFFLLRLYEIINVVTLDNLLISLNQRVNTL